MSFCSLNVYGGLEQKLENPDFVNEFQNNDIIFFSETWTNKYSKLNLKGFSEPICKHRRRRKKAKRDSGGLCVFVKKEIEKGIKCLNWDEFEDGLVIKLDKNLFGLEEDIFLVCVYIKPQRSSRNDINTDIESFEKVTDKIAELSSLGQVILMGDLNSRTSSFTDFPLDNENETNFIMEDSDRKITSEDLLFNNLSCVRVNKDSCVNDNGRMLIRLSSMSSMLILNGRSGRDKNVGNFTYCETKKDKLCKSTVDYVLCSKNMLYNICNFEIKDFNIFSDHAAICFNITCNFHIDDLSRYKSENCRKIKWKEDLKEEFVNNLSDEKVELELQEILDTLEKASIINETLINDSVAALGNILRSAGKDHAYVKHSKKDSGVGQGRWYDQNCKNKKAIFDNYRKRYFLSHLEQDKISMCKARTEYRKICRRNRKEYHIKKADELLNLSRTNQKKFWNSFRKKKAPTGDCDFQNYFKNLYESKSNPGVLEEEIVYDPDIDNLIFDVTFLNNNILMHELEFALSKLRNNKACGMDEILNEFLKTCTYPVKNVMLKLFNVILNSGIFPKEWAQGEIIPVFKKGNINDPHNYRGITLVSCLGKLFTFIINERLNAWAEENHVICENQFGFRKDKSTTDCLFILHGLIQHYLSNPRNLYCCFVDLTRAFDSVDRSVLWFKLQRAGISCKIINLIKDMYNKIQLCVKNVSHMMKSFDPGRVSSHVSDNVSGSPNDRDSNNYMFTSYSGVFQGECLSPFLFSMFINDICDYFSSRKGVGLAIEDLVLTVLMFADDMVVFSDTKSGLQEGLVALKEYCDMWGLEVNRNKTKCVVFKKGGKIGKKEQWFYDGKELETVGQFKYLGLVFGSSGKFAKTFDNILTQSYKALFNMKALQHQYPEINIKANLHLFDTLVLPVLNYGSEIWGFAKAEKLEKFYLNYLKTILHVRQSTPSCFIYKEIEVLPLITHRLLRIFKFWLKIVCLPDSSLLKYVYNLMIYDMENVENITNWVSLLKKTLDEYGFGYLWNQQHLLHKNENFLISLFKQRVQDIHLQNIHSDIDNVSNSRLYKHINMDFLNNKYLYNIQDKFIRVALTKLRLGSHNLMIERGRWMKLEVKDRECSTCGKLDDELHFITECELYTVWREKYIPRWLYVRPSMYKLVSFLDNVKENELRNFGLYCYKAFNYIQNNIV